MSPVFRLHISNNYTVTINIKRRRPQGIHNEFVIAENYSKSSVARTLITRSQRPFRTRYRIPNKKNPIAAGIYLFGIISGDFLFILIMRREEIRESVREFQSLIVWAQETGLINISPSQNGLKCQMMIPSTPFWVNMVICGYTSCSTEKQSSRCNGIQ